MSDTDRAFVGSIPDIYDTYMGPLMFEVFAVDLARRFAGFDGSLLETAAGTGRVTRALARTIGPGARIVATDLNEPMIARGAEAVRDRAVTWQQADAQQLPFDDASFDAVVCQFGVMFYPDKAAGHSQARRVLRSGGRYVFSVWDNLAANDVTRVAQEAMKTIFPDDTPDFMARVPFGYHDRDRIRSDLGPAAFASIEIETVTLPTTAPSASDAAIALCMGTPLRAEIERRPGTLDDAVAAVTEALATEFGTGAIAGRGQAIVTTALA